MRRWGGAIIRQGKVKQKDEQEEDARSVGPTP